MSLVTNDKSCMFFVGGNDYKSNSPAGSTFAGGCTRAWWDSQANIDTVSGKETAMGKLMEADGSAAVSPAVTHSSGTASFVRLNASTNDFSGIEAGMCLFHPDSGYGMSGPGIYEVIAIDTTNAAYVEINEPFSASARDSDGDYVYVGGAWSDLDTLATNYVSSGSHSQAIWINKDFAETASYDLSGWADGSPTLNTYCCYRCFHRTPFDMHKGGVYHQTYIDQFVNGVDSDKMGVIDFQGYDTDGFSFSYNTNMVFENLFIKGIYETSGTRTACRFDTGCENIIFNHCSTKGGYGAMTGLCDGLYLFDFFIDQSGFAGSAYILSLNIGSFAVYDGGIVKQHASNTAEAFKHNNCPMVVLNCMVVDGSRAVSSVHGDKTYISNCTFYNQSLSAVRTGSYTANGMAVERNSINLLKDANGVAFLTYSSSGAKEGSVFEDHNCSYALTDAVLTNYGDGWINGEDVSVNHNSIQVDPLLDSNYEPLEDDVRIGGNVDIQGDATSIGAIQTMNTTVINTAVQAALTAQGYTTGRAPKLDNLDQTISTVDTSSCKLAADGLDSVVVAEPTGDPSGWSFAKCLRWLIMRFMNKHTSDNYTGISVHKDDGTVSTTQAVTETNGVKSVSAVQ